MVIRIQSWGWCADAMFVWLSILFCVTNFYVPVTAISDAKSDHIRVFSEFTSSPAVGNLTGLIEAESTPKKWNITLCAMVLDVFPFALEWIEFHRIQGVDHFVLYDDKSEDDIRLLPTLYESIGEKGLIEIFPANFIFQSLGSDHHGDLHDHNQRNSLSHCHARYRSSSRWMLFIDLDEFIHSPRHGSLTKFLDAYSNHTDIFKIANVSLLVSQFYVQPLRFGTSGLLDDFRVNLNPDPMSGDIVLNYEPVVDGGDLFPLIIEANPRRAPHYKVDGDFGVLYRDICHKTNRGGMCGHANGKSIFKPERCSAPYIHWCESIVGYGGDPPFDELRIDHFAWRSMESVSKLTSDWHGGKVAVYDALDRIWFSRIEDVSKRQYVSPLRNAFTKFRRKVQKKKPRSRKRPQWLLDSVAAIAKNLSGSVILYQ